MSKCQALLELLEADVIPEIEEHLDSLFAQIAAEKNASAGIKMESKDIQELLSEFRALVEDLKAGELDAEECDELYEEISSMRDEDFEDEE